MHRRKSVYKEVPNQGKECISLTKRLIKGKSVDNENLVKARLCARGFKEEQNLGKHSSSSSREGLHLNCLVIVSNKCTLNLLDVKAVLWQVEKMEHNVFVRLPKEINISRF